MSVNWIEVEGFRGFSKPVRLNLSKPNGTVGSGLTVLVGPNNTGKSTMIEAFTALNDGPPSMSEGKRNRLADARVRIELEYEGGARAGLSTIAAGGSETE